MDLEEGFQHILIQIMRSRLFDPFHVEVEIFNVASSGMVNLLKAFSD